MTAVLTLALALTSLAILVLALRHGGVRLYGPQPVGTATLIAILFTSGLDVGLILFPLLDFDRYAAGAAYQFANPLAIEFGFWGFWVWGLYFLSAAYFCLFEPRLKLFEHPWVKTLHNGIILGTCAFTAYLFLLMVPDYLPSLNPPRTLALVAVVVLLAVASSLRFQVLRWLSVGSSLIFLALVLRGAVVADLGGAALLARGQELAAYFQHFPRFLSPLSDYHEFYLFWWFTWSLMIGQFIARFLAGQRTVTVLALLLVVPSIPLALWFAVLYQFHLEAAALPERYALLMVAVGILFLVNSLDSLTRLYTQNLALSPERLGAWAYLSVNWVLIYGLVLLFRYTPLKIEWLGLAVLGLYGVIGFQMLKHRVEAVT
jgi:glycine betaine transporter